MSSGFGIKSRAPCSTSSINLGTCCDISNVCSSNDGIPVLLNALYVGSVKKFVKESRIGCGMEMIDGVIRSAKPGMSVGID